ncbi:homogentisate phytyltransferase [Phaeodactylibacter sp.]|jgi:homogentisate phytyltransferase/homogentisate geranylgeranyltransferase|uniref:homogentisate phytyltransferase n=1 Tax=Phaeodactylibacter sp. TaxID=1940289 RepID=UPI0025E6B88E|nr:homogentisate phytyltransferase [Phaeodactylibacter sp.]MCI4649446.1 homogentisate phytyltransferase [Phaeodactylibacter sp.]MCI5090946.1 homogentisate phytyltransferase [Phaeodactylibacter sp.]
MMDFIRFSRPHTIIGTSLSVLALFVLALSYAGKDTGDWHTFLTAWISCLGANIFIVGLNQLTDIEIDRINKPYLPLASGAYTVRTGQAIIGIALFIALALAVYGGPFLMWTVGLSLLLGIAYSLPPLRLKRFHFWAAFCIIAVRGLIVNLLLFLHFYNQLSGETALPPIIIWLTVAIFIYGLIIAWFKDMPDTAGDEAYRIQTLSIKVGLRRVFWIGNSLLGGLFLLLATLPLWADLQVHHLLFGLGHLSLLLGFLLLASRVDLSEKASIMRYYQAVWGLFFLEYGLFATAGWLA